MATANIQQGMAIYRKPQASLPEFCVGQWRTGVLESLDEAATFCLQPFDTGAPLNWLKTVFRGAGWQDCGDVWMERFSTIPTLPMPVSTSKSEFESEVLGIQAAIAKNAIEKAVAARVVSTEKPMTADNIWQAFCDLHEAYPTAFVFLVIHPVWGCWMGATPETLLQVNDIQAMVMSLAGTLTKEQGGWTSKEALEQSVTSRFIRDVLQQVGIADAEETAVGELRMGDVRHLMSEWRFNLQQGSGAMASDDRSYRSLDVYSLLTRLHPTPAVGGYPQQAALDWLVAHEGLDRSLYTGYLGVIGDQSSHVFVTLRCVQLFSRGYALYAGCGVNAGSDPAVEWLETAAKMDLLGRYLR